MGLPEGNSPIEYKSKSFMKSNPIHDFRLGGKHVFLRVSKPIWRHKETGATIQRDFTSMAGGFQLTQELEEFPKDAPCYANRFHEQI